MVRIAKLCAALAMMVGVGGCGLGSVLESDTIDRAQQFPASHKAELLAFFRNYLNDPVAVRNAAMAEPVQRNVGGQPRFVSCLKFNARESDGSYRGVKVRGVVYTNGRLDRVVDEIGDLCDGVSYAPFPELEKMSR